jgi:hypothetical protein
LDSFSEGFAWIVFVVYYKDETNVTYDAMINKKGEIIFANERQEIYDSSTRVPMSGGYAYLFSDNTKERSRQVKIINTTGDVVSSQNVSLRIEFRDKLLRAYGEGYTLVEEYISTFDTSYYTYTIYNYDGSEIEKFEMDNDDRIEKVFYSGKGVFGFQSHGKYNSSYFVENDLWVDGSTCAQPFYGDSEMAIVDFINYTDSKGNRDVRLFLMNLEGEVTEIKLFPEYDPEWNTNVMPLNENICILVSLDKTMHSYSLLDNKVSKLDEKYAKKINWETVGYSCKSGTLVFENGRITLPLIGDDREAYRAVFDTEWNLVFEPSQDIDCYSEDRLIVSTEEGTFVYDENGEECFSLTEKGYRLARRGEYSDGVLYVVEDEDEGKNSYYLDKDGNELFKVEDIDISSVIRDEIE